MKSLIHTNWGVNTPIYKGLVEQMSIANTIPGKKDLFHFSKSDKILNMLKDVSAITFERYYNCYNDLYDQIVKDYNKDLKTKWNDIYEQIDVSWMESYEGLYIFGGAFNGNFYRHPSANTFPNTHKGVNWVSSGSKMIYLLAMLKANKLYNIPMHEVIFDPLEMSLNLIDPDFRPVKYKLYHGYTHPEYGIERLDSLQYFLNNKPIDFFSDDTKTIDLTFGYTAIDGCGTRADILNEIDEKIQKAKTDLDTVVILVKTKDIDTTIPRDNYLDLIKKSRFTYVFRAYEKQSFSVYRFVESIYNDCLPILSTSCNIHQMNQTFGIDLSELMIDDFPSESKRLELLKYYKSKVCVFEKGFVK